MEIISSKASYVSDVEGEEKNEILTAGRTEGVLLTPLAKTSDEGNHGDMKKDTIRTATRFPQPNVRIMTLSLVLWCLVLFGKFGFCIKLLAIIIELEKL